MLPSLVIGLREGLEAALLVAIIAAFLRANGSLALLRWVWFGVAAAVTVALGVGIALRVASQNLPTRQQESLETIIAAVAVGMVTYMVVWMRRHAAGIKTQLEEVLSRHTGQSVERIHRDTDRDYVMTAEQARDYGLIDEVLVSREQLDNSGPIR